VINKAPTLAPPEQLIANGTIQLVSDTTPGTSQLQTDSVNTEANLDMLALSQGTPIISHEMLLDNLMWIRSHDAHTGIQLMSQLYQNTSEVRRQMEAGIQHPPEIWMEKALKY
jgi:hypothetical protein